MTAPDAPLRRLAAILDEEAEALRTLDMAAIDRAAQAKEALEPELARVLRAPMAPDAADQLPALRERARQNQRRLAATLASVRGLVRALVSDDAPTYGPPTAGGSPPAGTTKPILTSVVG
jgi:hypothetical protein